MTLTVFAAGDFVINGAKFVAIFWSCNSREGEVDDFLPNLKVANLVEISEIYICRLSSISLLLTSKYY